MDTLTHAKQSSGKSTSSSTGRQKRGSESASDSRNNSPVPESERKRLNSTSTDSEVTLAALMNEMKSLRSEIMKHTESQLSPVLALLQSHTTKIDRLESFAMKADPHLVTIDEAIGRLEAKNYQLELSLARSQAKERANCAIFHRVPEGTDKEVAEWVTGFIQKELNLQIHPVSIRKFGELQHNFGNEGPRPRLTSITFDNTENCRIVKDADYRRRSKIKNRSELATCPAIFPDLPKFLRDHNRNLAAERRRGSGGGQRGPRHSQSQTGQSQLGQ